MPLTTEPINGVPTRLIRRLSPTARDLVLVIPGNPGVAGLYAPFIEHLFVAGGGRFSVAIASHVGHSPGHLGPHGFYSLQDQHDHHLAFLESLPPAPTVHLIGHSIGAWLALGLLDVLPDAQRGRAFLLFPTIERMAKTPNGRLMSPLFGPLRRPGLGLVRLIHRIPGRERLLRRLLLSGAPECDHPSHIAGILDLTPTSVHNVLRMAGEELAVVDALPAALLKRHAHRLSLYYGQRDPWNLPDMADGVARRIPGVEVIRCSQGISHAFVFDGNAYLASFVTSRLAADADPAAP